MSKEVKRSRRMFSTEQKVAILRRHLVDKVPVSDLCDEYKLQPSLLYQWQRQLFENMAGASEAAASNGRRSGNADSRKRSSTWRADSPAKTPLSPRSLPSMCN
jgi:transposase